MISILTFLLVIFYLSVSTMVVLWSENKLNILGKIIFFGGYIMAGLMLVLMFAIMLTITGLSEILTKKDGDRNSE